MLPNNIKYEHCPVRLEARTPPFHGGNRGSTPLRDANGSLAQLVEQLTFNQLVAGSNPARPTILSHEGIKTIVGD